jgi:hypothetical protein
VSLATVCRRLATLVGVQPADVWIGNPDLTASEDRRLGARGAARGGGRARLEQHHVEASRRRCPRAPTRPASAALGPLAHRPGQRARSTTATSGGRCRPPSGSLRSRAAACAAARLHAAGGQDLLAAPASGGGVLSYSYVTRPFPITPRPGRNRARRGRARVRPHVRGLHPVGGARRVSGQQGPAGADRRRPGRSLDCRRPHATCRLARSPWSSAGSPAPWPALATGSGGGIVDADLEHACSTTSPGRGPMTRGDLGQ